jgi:hypothetical protein
LNNLSVADKVWVECPKEMRDYGFKNLEENLALAHQHRGNIYYIVDELGKNVGN